MCPHPASIISLSSPAPICAAALIFDLRFSALSGYELIAEQLFVKLLDGLVLLPGLRYPLAELSERILALRFRRLDPCLEDRFGELALIVHLAEYLPDLADDQLEHVDLLVEDAQHMLFKRAARDRVEDEDLARLPDAVDAADALLNRHRVPRQVEVDERVAELQVAPLAARFGGEQERRFHAKTRDARVLLRPAHRAFKPRKWNGLLLRQLRKTLKCFVMMDEDDLFLFGVAFEQFEQRLLFDCRPA